MKKGRNRIFITMDQSPFFKVGENRVSMSWDSVKDISSANVGSSIIIIIENELELAPYKMLDKLKSACSLGKSNFEQVRLSLCFAKVLGPTDWLWWSSKYVKKLMNACHIVSVACRPAKMCWQRCEIG